MSIDTNSVISARRALRKINFQRKTLAEQLADAMAETLVGQVSFSRNITEHLRMPSVREIAKQTNISPNTVTSAIQLLATRQLVKVHPRKGIFFVDGIASSKRSASE